jgi:hypothetical protein
MDNATYEYLGVLVLNILIMVFTLIIFDFIWLNKIPINFNHG